MSMLNEKKELSIVVINSRFIFSNALHVCRNVLFLWWYLNRLKMELMKEVVTTTGRLKRVTVTIYLLLLDEMPTNIAHTKTGIKRSFTKLEAACGETCSDRIRFSYRRDTK